MCFRRMFFSDWETFKKCFKTYLIGLSVELCVENMKLLVKLYIKTKKKSDFEFCEFENFLPIKCRPFLYEHILGLLDLMYKFSFFDH